MCRPLLPDSTTAPRGPCRWSSRGAKSRSAPALRGASLSLCRVIAGGSQRFDSERFHLQGGPRSSSNPTPHCADASRPLRGKPDSLRGSPATVAPWPRQWPAAPRTPGIGFGLVWFEVPKDVYCSVVNGSEKPETKGIVTGACTPQDSIWTLCYMK